MRNPNDIKDDISMVPVSEPSGSEVNQPLDGMGGHGVSTEVVGGHNQNAWVLDDRMKRMLMDLQRHWLSEHQQSREKLLVEMTEKLHQEFLSDQQKIKTELLTQFKEELDATKSDVEQKFQLTLKAEISKMNEKHRREISQAKKKQWCWQCEAEAIYHCCWNTAYCSVDCQQLHWPTHRRFCRRKKAPNQP
ncbi:zinc finger MYND domain-containing protein 11 [Ditylenchus destructor]|uniref:Zinc finger MYND domain-containing protein 11 n=1 Tax=Ditylenchus destructor TaxID=166010 RepID=A0AAD4QZ46_9BILA|nr:zinc finger MYND domain-containing protein 11 [Ditylenchus destructor]